MELKKKWLKGEIEVFFLEGGGGGGYTVGLLVVNEGKS